MGSTRKPLTVLEPLLEIPKPLRRPGDERICKLQSRVPFPVLGPEQAKKCARTFVVI